LFNLHRHNIIGAGFKYGRHHKRRKFKPQLSGRELANDNQSPAAKESTDARPGVTATDDAWSQPQDNNNPAANPQAGSSPKPAMSANGPTLEEPAPPAKPPRPLSPREQAEKTLKEAFPSIDATVVKAVLSASGGQVEPAFDALLGMTDPDSQKEAPPPAKPPRPTQQSAIPTSTALSQLEADELYARQLDEHLSGARRPQRQNVPPNQQAPRQRAQPEQEREYSFLDDDLPVIKDNIRKGFLETQSTVNKWVTSFKKKLDGEDEESFSNQPARPAQGYQAGGQSYPNYGRRSAEMARRSADRERYDADPQVLGDDFSRLELRDGEGKVVGISVAYRLVDNVL
jgi:CUE domain